MNAPAELPVDRRTFLGGSDAAAVFGVSQWSTPLDIYLRKRGEMPETGRDADPMRERIFKRGKRLEPVVLEMAAEEWNLKVTKASTPAAQNRYVDPEHGFLACEVDFEWLVTNEIADALGLPDELVGTIQNGEIKTVHPFAAGKFGEDESDEVPIEYAAQAMHGLMITGREVCLFAVLVGADNLSRYLVRRDEETIAAMREKEVAFWVHHVEAGVPPAPLNIPDVYHLFRRDIGTQIQATAEMLDLVEKLKYAKATVKGGEDAIEDLQFKIGFAMLGEKAVQQDPKGKIKPTDETPPGHHILKAGSKDLLTIRFQSQTRIDSDAVRVKYPEVAEVCSKTSKFFTFNLSRKKS